LAPTVGQSTAASGVKFRLGPSSALGEKVASGLVWRFDTFDCVSENLAHFKNGFGNSGSFLDVGSHRFYVAKPFLEEVTDVFDPLSDGGLSCGESSSLGAMVEVMALGEEEGGDSPRPECPSPECLLPQEQDAPLPEQDAPDVSMVDLRAPLSRVIDPARVAEAQEWTRLVLLSKVAEDEANRCRASTTLSEFYDMHGDAPTELAHDPWRSFATAGPSQIQRPQSASRGRRGRGQGGRAPSSNARGHRAQQGGGAGMPHQVPVPAPGSESQARPLVLHIHLWLDHVEAFPGGSASSKRAASDQGGPGAAGSGQGRKEGKYTLDAALDQPYKFHNSPGREATHSTRQCRFMTELEQRARQIPGASQAQPAGGQEDQQHDPAGGEPDQDDDCPVDVEQYHIFTTPGKDKRNDLWHEVEVNAVMPAEPQFMHWSEAAITWGREDHPRLMPSPGEYALVLDPVVCSDTHMCRFSRVLIDSGSSINLLYRSSLEKLGIPLAQLKPSRLTFHGIVPGHFCTPLGKVQLDVLFRKKGNSRREPIWFEVVDISSPYHALLGRPALAKFMAVPHYAYLKMKLPGPRGVITVSGSFKKSLACAKESSQLAEALVVAEEKRQLLHRVELAQQDVPVRQSPVEQFKPANVTKKILLDESDPTKYVIIDTGLSTK
jgi:hypothetical protein